MNENTQTNSGRADDARLHTLLYGVACEWQGCELQPEGDWMVYRSEWPSDGNCPIHPCFKNHNDIWHIVPFYSSDIAAAWEAEGALPIDIRKKYLYWLHIKSDACDWQDFNDFGAIWFFRRATHAQMVAAMLRALEGKG